MSALYAAHAAGKVTSGVDVEESGVRDAAEAKIFDLYKTKSNALQLAVEVGV